MVSKKFNIRVYGILEYKNQILVSDENRFGKQFTKFPGGGLEWGESVIDCLKREFEEELGIDIEVGALFYLTDFFQVSAFHDKDQIISVYYHVNTAFPEKITCQKEKFNFNGEEQVFRWIKKKDLNDLDVTFPIDKHVVNKIRNNFIS